MKGASIVVHIDSNGKTCGDCEFCRTCIITECLIYEEQLDLNGRGLHLRCTQCLNAEIPEKKEKKP